MVATDMSEINRIFNIEFQRLFRTGFRSKPCKDIMSMLAQARIQLQAIKQTKKP